jgi:hypothetical protein
VSMSVTSFWLPPSFPHSVFCFPSPSPSPSWSCICPITIALSPFSHLRDKDTSTPHSLVLIHIKVFVSSRPKQRRSCGSSCGFLIPLLPLCMFARSLTDFDTPTRFDEVRFLLFTFCALFSLWGMVVYTTLVYGLYKSVLSLFLPTQV